MMRAALLVWLALPATAQTQSEADILPRLIDTGCFRLVDDLNGCEQVTLLESQTEPDAADLLIFPDRRTDEAEGPLLVLRGMVFNGAMWGMAPALEETADGFRLTSEQTGIGRYPWFETIDVGHDGTGFIVTRYSYSAYDRAWPRYVSCEADFLAGTYRAEWERGDPENEEADPEIHQSGGVIDAGPVPLRDWRMHSLRPAPCRTAADAAFSGD